MFLFYHSDQNESNINFYKGVLFEELLKEYLTGSGYIVELRKKQSSLEYDIEGTARTTGQKIIGEAKAHSKSMSGQSVAAFVGKLLPLGLIEKKVHGLFLSLSPLTPEAEDYFRNVKELGLTTKVGQELYSEVCDILNLPSEKSIEKNIKGHEVVAPNILKTNTGTYRLLVLKKNDSGTPSAFAVYGRDGQQVTESEFLEKLKANVSELSGLDFWLPTDNSQKNTEQSFKREILKGLSVGTDWADYRLPAGPSVFVGRNEFVDKLSNHIKNSEIPHVLQVKSRSGVGKSSLYSGSRNPDTNLRYALSK